MSFETKPHPAISARNLSKSYELYRQPQDRLKQMLWGRWRNQPYYSQHWALKDVSLTIERGEVVGLVGRNGAGKSTLLQLLCGTLQASEGELQVNGRVAALLELGAGFNPDFTGLENVFMNAAILGMSRAEVNNKLQEIVSFADIGAFIDQPVKTYSSGMFVRLAFSVATSIEPDILVIDEALSVGDGAFARKSFERIMQLKEQGKTILFCSHSMYQVEALCSRALWLEGGELRMQGIAADVTSAYLQSLDSPASSLASTHAAPRAQHPHSIMKAAGQLCSVEAICGNQRGSEIHLQSWEDDLQLEIKFLIDPELPSPGVAVGISDMHERTISSAISVNDGVILQVSETGHGFVRLSFPKFPLLKGSYRVTAILTTENGIHPYDMAKHCITLHVKQEGTAQGVVELPHHWLA
jgi:lipopolysaccharide transport system ATP-binding protein